MGLAMASLVFSACEKEQFSEENALALEKQRLELQDQLATARDELENKQAIGMMEYQRKLDSLDRINSGGLVYYSVIPVKGTNAVFASGMGRTEEIQGEKGLEVTIAQYGRVITATEGVDNENTVAVGDEKNLTGASANNGVYTFPMLRSGEIGVTIEGDGLSTVNYVANLTPDGAVANGQVVYVSNMIPVFETNVAESDTKMATVKGKVWYEGDLTNGTEEVVTSDMGVSITANIDVEGSEGGRGSVFWKRYFAQANDEGFGISNDTDGNDGTSYGTNGNTKSGYIQRFAYELGSLPRTVAGSGDLNTGEGGYGLLVPSTSIGLPIKLEFSEFGADRTFYRNGQVVKTRHMYAPDVPADDVESGVKLPEFVFTAYKSEATGTATYTKADYSGKLDGDGTKDYLFLTAGLHDDGNAHTSAANFMNVNGYASSSKTKTGFFGVSNAKTRWPNLKPKAGDAVAEVTKVTDITDGAGFTIGKNLKAISQVQLTNTGTNYSDETNGTEIDAAKSGKELEFNVTRDDIVAIGEAKSNGTSANKITNVQITNSGFGFTPPATSVTSITQEKVFTGYFPSVVIDAPGGNNTQAKGVPVIDQRTGVITHVVVTDGGSGYTNAAGVSLTYGDNVNYGSQTSLDWSQEPLLIGSNGDVKLNTSNVGGSAYQGFTLNGSSIVVNGKYSYLPGAEITARPADNSALEAAITTKLQEYGSKFTYNKSVGTSFAQNGFLTADPATFGQLTLSLSATPNLFNPFTSVGSNRTFAQATTLAERLASYNNNSSFATVKEIDASGQRFYAFSSVLLADAAVGSRSTSNLGVTLQITPENTASQFSAVAQVGSTAVGVDQYTIKSTANTGADLAGLNIASNIDNGSGNLSTDNGTFSTVAGQGPFVPYYSILQKSSYTNEFIGGYLIPDGAYNNPSTGLTADDVKEFFLKDRPFLVQATGTGITKYAWGIPNFTNGGQIEGIRWFDLGQGYTSTGEYTIKLIPNLYQDFTKANKAGADAIWPTNNDLEGQLNSTLFLGRVYAEYDKLDAQLSLTISNGGEGYAQKPRVVIVKDGADFSGQAIMAVSQTIEGRLIVDANGAVSIKDTDGDGNPAELKEGIINIDGLEGTVVDGMTISKDLSDVWDRYLDPGKKTAEYNLIFIDRLSEDVAIAFNSVTGRTTDMPSGVLTVDANGGLVLDMTKKVSGKEAWMHLPAVTYNYKPTVEVKSDVATEAATAETEVFYTDGTFNNADAWKIKVKITTKGKGYVRGNQYYNYGDKDYHEADNNNKGQDFRVIGGFNGGTTDNVANETNVRFDAFTGITYVRDVHYGTGVEIE